MVIESRILSVHKRSDLLISVKDNSIHSIASHMALRLNPIFVALMAISVSMSYVRLMMCCGLLTVCVVQYVVGKIF